MYQRERTHLVVGQLQLQLLYARLDGVPARQAVADGHVAREAEVFRLEDLVCARVVEDRLGVDAGLVREGTVARYRVAERHRHLDGLRDEVLYLTQRGKVVLALDVLRVRRVQARDEPSERRNAYPLADTEDR